MSVLGLPFLYAGKVRDMYALGDDPATAEQLMIVTSDRLSVYDRVLNDRIPDKGRVLTALSAFWFHNTDDVLPHHLLSTDVADLPRELRAVANRFDLDGRVAIVARAQMLPVECIVRRYLTGSAWREYAQFGTVNHQWFPPGLAEGSLLSEPMFTPSTKAPIGQRDEGLSPEGLIKLLGAARAGEVEAISLELYRRGAARAWEQGIVVADTKFELGLIGDRLVLCDEVLTPDSSRLWPVGAQERMGTTLSFDKQPVRDHMDRLGWDRQSAPPPLPAQVISATRERYIRAFELLTGESYGGQPCPPPPPERFFDTVVADGGVRPVTVSPAR